ncbi:hypothetical protein EOD39_13939 [Acipenser ruthenus]|uniref:Uncharacterized protein n=1 Tax=Acipenser ruthenus TaxID=7906 RepID=A0A662YN32_ACIRT|nr:hypothetical protein EOD39_13939 [Acipenser ruthenus]
MAAAVVSTPTDPEEKIKMDIAELLRTLEKVETQEATRKQQESNRQWRQEQGLPTRELEFPASGLERLLQKGVWPTPKQESSVPELPATIPIPEPGVPVQEPELSGQEPEVQEPLLEE